MNNNQKGIFILTVVPQRTTSSRCWILYRKDNLDEIYELMNDSGTKLITPEEIKLTENPNNAIVLTPEKFPRC